MKFNFFIFTASSSLYQLPQDVEVVNGAFFSSNHQEVIDRLDASTSEK
jgi:hypothetical protein|tara:strand:- start:645 stop:788 length:144 start_codon:yes stop_codon:yes gene_type:complete